MKLPIAFVAMALTMASFLLTGAPADAQETPSFTSGLARTVNAGLVDCRGRGSRTSAVGRIASEDGKEWTVPAPTNFTRAPKAYDLHNPCGGQRLRGTAELDLNRVPMMDAGGTETFTAYIFADNYFEFYANGLLIAVDPVPFTPFNSNVIRFKASRPFSVAIMGVDWEENLGQGTEANRGSRSHPGDAGLVAVIKDASGRTVAITDGSWKAQTFYTAPLADRNCLRLNGAVRDSSACPNRAGNNPSAAHWPIPANWYTARFDDSGWPQATVFTNRTVGVDNKRSYTDFTDVFDDPRADARFIWSTNLVLDNLVLMRKTVR